MIEEIDEVIADMRELSRLAEGVDDELVGIFAKDAAELLSAVRAILPQSINKRRCHDCGRVAYHADTVAPYVCCAKCGSQDTRVVRPRTVSAG